MPYKCLKCKCEYEVASQAIEPNRPYPCPACGLPLTATKLTNGNRTPLGASRCGSWAKPFALGVGACALIVAGCLLWLPGRAVRVLGIRNDEIRLKGIEGQNRIEGPAAQRFADAAVADLLQGRNNSLYERMEDRFKNTNSLDAFLAELDRLFAFAGQPLTAKYKADETGDKFYPDGTHKPVRKFWYAVQTTKEDGAPYFLFVELVSARSGLACTSMSIVHFPGTGPPPYLR